MKVGGLYVLFQGNVSVENFIKEGERRPKKKMNKKGLLNIIMESSVSYDSSVL